VPRRKKSEGPGPDLRGDQAEEEKTVSARRSPGPETQEEESTLRAILDGMVDGLITIDEKGIVQSFNRAAERMFGYMEPEVRGKNVKLLMPSSYSRHHDDYIRNYLTTGERRIIGIGREVEGLRKDGTIFPLSLAVSESWIEGKRLFIGNIRDLTLERGLREQLYQAEKFASIGELVAGIAHEIGGPLSVISGNAEFLRESFQASDPRWKDVDGIIRECDVVAQLMRRLLDFSRPGRIELRPLDLNEGLRNVFSLVRKQFSKDKVEVKLDLQVSLPRIMGDPNHLEQVFMNMVLNARNAMSKGGTLTISSYVGNVYGDDGRRRVCVEFRDTGEGIPQENLERIFEPYFTTRKPGKGTGLGLAICQRIIAEHRGFIRVYSQVGSGTTFTVCLRSCDEDAS
jgi:PAS domain S-box-containing protein